MKIGEVGKVQHAALLAVFKPETADLLKDLQWVVVDVEHSPGGMVARLVCPTTQQWIELRDAHHFTPSDDA